MNDTIFSYWEGPKSALIEICQESLCRWNPARVRVLGPDDVPAPLLEATAGISLAYRSDLVRLWALLNHGGLWVDADTVCMSEISEVDQIPELDLFGVFNPHQRRGWGVDGVLATPIGGRKNSPVLREMYDQCLRSVRRIQSGERVPYGWTSVGLATAAWKRHRDRPSVRRKQHWQLHPVPWYLRAASFLSEQRPAPARIQLSLESKREALSFDERRHQCLAKTLPSSIAAERFVPWLSDAESSFDVTSPVKQYRTCAGPRGASHFCDRLRGRSAILLTMTVGALRDLRLISATTSWSKHDAIPLSSHSSLLLKRPLQPWDKAPMLRAKSASQRCLKGFLASLSELRKGLSLG